MKTCTLCKEPVDTVNQDGLCGECVGYVHNEEARDMMGQENYLKYCEDEE